MSRQSTDDGRRTTDDGELKVRFQGSVDVGQRLILSEVLLDEDRVWGKGTTGEGAVKGVKLDLAGANEMIVPITIHYPLSSPLSRPLDHWTTGRGRFLVWLLIPYVGDIWWPTLRRR